MEVRPSDFCTCLEKPEIMAKVLIVDDAEMNAELLAEIVGMFGVDSMTASNGKEAVDLVRRETFDLIFMDHLMPVMDGLEAMAIIKKEKLCPSTPVVMVTANDSAADGDIYKEAGFSEYLKKPIPSKDVRAIFMKYGIIGCDGEKDEWRKFSKKIKGIDIEGPMQYFLNDFSFYTEVLYEYSRNNTFDWAEKMLTFQEVSVLLPGVRAAKDAARLIGAVQLAELALSMERDIEDGDEKSFLEHLGNYRLLEKKLKKTILKTESLAHSHS